MVSWLFLYRQRNSVEESCQSPCPTCSYSQVRTFEEVWEYVFFSCLSFLLKALDLLHFLLGIAFCYPILACCLRKLKKKYSTHTTISYLKGPGSRRYKRFILKYSNPQISVCRLFFCICVCFVKSRAQDHLILYKKVWFDHKILFYTPRPIPLYILKCEHMQSKLHIQMPQNTLTIYKHYLNIWVYKMCILFIYVFI